MDQDGDSCLDNADGKVVAVGKKWFGGYGIKLVKVFWIMKMVRFVGVKRVVRVVKVVRRVCTVMDQDSRYDLNGENSKVGKDDEWIVKVRLRDVREVKGMKRQIFFRLSLCHLSMLL